MTYVIRCAALLFAALLTATAGAQTAMEPREVAPGAWYVQGAAALGSRENQNFVSNAGFVVTPAGVVVIDALGSPVAARRLLETIARITPLPVTHVIVTHYHADHIYGLQVLQQAGARILAHAGGRDYLQSETAQLRLQVSRTEMAPWIDDSTRLVAADQWLAGPGELEVGGVRFLLQPVGPSHTPEDLVVFLPDRKLLFAGDVVFRGRVPYVGQADSRHWITALDTLLLLDAQVIVPGHGPHSTGARADLQLTRDYLQYLRQAMGRAARNLDPFEAAYAATDWSRFSHLPLFQQANRMNAYNTFLLLEHEPAE
jgi:glyoxylase-like metal-dependent hydrolase (beta-lactamase superfamily II)